LWALFTAKIAFENVACWATIFAYRASIIVSVTIKAALIAAWRQL
jgi:hypothetical protein